MIHEYDRRWYIGGSDIDKYVMAKNQQTKSWQKWWAVKCGLAENEYYGTSAMRTGTMLEHSILKSWDANIEWDGQILYPDLMLRINYDGWSSGSIFEVKCHRASTNWSVDAYRGQIVTQAWVYEKMAEELGLPPFKEICVLEYAFTPEEECTIYDPATAEAGDIQIDRNRINCIPIKYKSKQFHAVRSHLRPLAKQLKRIAPQERREEMAVVWSMKLFKADAGKVYKDLEKIGEKTPQNIVDYAAKHPKSELYKCFTWDDSKAANEWRKQEARQVVRLLVFEDEETEEPTKVRVLQKASESYEPVKMIVRDQDEYKALLERAYAELRAFKERYKNLVELEQIMELIDSI